jgi:hypothetical protein
MKSPAFGVVAFVVCVGLACATAVNGDWHQAAMWGGFALWAAFYLGERTRLIRRSNEWARYAHQRAIAADFWQKVAMANESESDCLPGEGTIRTFAIYPSSERGIEVMRLLGEIASGEGEASD